MIDGVKIEVQALNGGYWLDSDLLDFTTPVSVNTGEMLTGTLHAKYRGLLFLLTRTQKTALKYYHTVRGSLHKFHNEGVHNADNYTHSDLLHTLQALEKDFNICLSSAYLRNIEIGVNIQTPIPAKAVINNLIACKGKEFETMRVAGKVVGKKVGFSQFVLKVYDKGKQYDLLDDNILRIELAFNKMQALRKYSISTLADLQDLDKVQPLGELLTSYWSDCIYFDKAVKWKGLTDFERKKLLYYATPRNWSEFSIKQRYRAKKHFAQLMERFNVLSTHSEISNLIAEKWRDLTAVKCPQIYQNTDEFCSRKMSTFLPLEYRVNTYLKPTPKKQKENSGKINLKNERKCKACNADISHKRANSLYCSKKCNNSYHAGIRKKKRNQMKQNEIKELERLLPKLKRSNWKIGITYGKGADSCTDWLEQREVTSSKEWTARVQSVVIQTPRKTILLTSYRARRFIKEINRINNN